MRVRSGPCRVRVRVRVVEFSSIRVLQFLPRDVTLERYMLSRVRLSQTGIALKRLRESSWVLVWRLPSTYPTLRCKKMWVSSKIRVLPSGTLSQTPDFAIASRSHCKQQLSSSPSSSTVEFVDDTYTTIDESWLFSTSRSTVTL